MPKPNRRPKRQIRTVMHIYCEGAKTEPNYLSGYIDEFFSDNRSLKIIKIEPTKKNTPKQLVDEAVTAKKENPKGDTFWVVYDRESRTKYADSLHAETRNFADAHDVNIALSNVCFEVWLLLHFEDSVGPYENFDDLWRRSSLKKRLPKYQKGDRSLYSKLSGGINAARKNAERLNKRIEDGSASEERFPHQWNPYTNVHELLDAIDLFAKSGKIK